MLSSKIIKPLANGIAHQLRDQGHAVDVLSDGEMGADVSTPRTGRYCHLRHQPYLAVSGLKILTRIRQEWGCDPSYLLTARGDTKDRVRGLDLGADDYYGQTL